jgi:hypothetical protein
MLYGVREELAHDLLHSPRLGILFDLHNERSHN